MTTRTRAEALLFAEPDVDIDVGLPEPLEPEKVLQICSSGKSSANLQLTSQPDRLGTMVPTPSATRRRVKPIYCPRCQSWVEITFQPVRLRCTGCGLEARP